MKPSGRAHSCCEQSAARRCNATRLTRTHLNPPAFAPDPNDLDLIDISSPGAGGKSGKRKTLLDEYQKWRSGYSVLTDWQEWQAGLKVFMQRHR